MSYTRPFDITDHHDYAREEETERCDMCNDEFTPNVIIREKLSGICMCPKCKDGFIKEWEADSDNKGQVPQFEN